MWVLPVGAITGPPYAISDIKPALGPLTGKTKVSINGAGFKESYGSINVRFTGGKGQIDVPGVYKSETLIECETPSFEQFGPRRVEVRLSFGKLDLTITKSEFTYFLNTKADQTIAFGPGLLHDNAVGVETMFYIQSRNADGKNRESGSDEFTISIRRPDLEQQVEEPMDAKKQREFDDLPEDEKAAILAKRAEAERIRLSRVQIDYKITDN
jgi:dynein heavy chain